MVRGVWALLRGRSVTEGIYYRKNLETMIAAESVREPFDVVLGYSSAVVPYLAAAGSGGKVVDLVDTDSAKWGAYAEMSRWPMKWVYRRESRAVARLEREAIETCGAVAVVSEAEVAALPSDKSDHEASVPRASVVVAGNGNDTDFFSSQGVRPAEMGNASLAFIGTMNYMPNVQGVCWFAKHVWPAIKRKVPEATFVIIGRDPSRAVRKLARMDGVRVTGSVEDVRPYLAGATVVVCPLLMARGVQNKVLEAMAMGKAIVVSPCSLQGVEATPGKHLVAAKSAEEWQEKILELLASAGLRNELGEAAARYVRETASWRERLAPLVTVCRELGRKTNRYAEV